MRISLLFFFIVFRIVPVICQTGPAGVGTPATNVFWIKGDKGTSSITNGTAINVWNDQSGNGINVTQTISVQQPSFATNVLNGFPAIQFDNNSTSGQNDYLTAPDNSKLDNTPGYSFFTTTKLNAIGVDARCIVSKRTAIDVDEAFMLFFWEPSYLYFDVDGLGDRQSTTPLTYTTNTPYIMDGIYDGSLPSASRSKIYEGEALRKTFSESSALVPDKPSPLNIGCTHASNNRPFGGYIAEVIIYTVTVNDAERIIVNNYLSSKYNVPLTANDKYLGDTPGNGDYDREVAGIGKESSGSNPTFSASVSSGLTIANTGGLDVGDYILAGHASPGNAQILYDVGGMTGINNARWFRIWYIDITNTSTALTNTIEFDMSDGGIATTLGSASDYVLLYRAAQTGNWTELVTATSVVGDRVVFPGVTLTNDGYYTIGTRNYLISPLPVELLSFNATKNNSKVDINWATASEKENASFNVEKSKDGISYETVFSCAGKGNTSSTTNYSGMDEYPFNGLSYYRLKQTDNNGNFTYSYNVALNFNNGSDAFIVFPNPSNGDISINIKGLQNQQLSLSITDALGRQCFSKDLYVTENDLVLDLSTYYKLAAGSYMVVMRSNNTVYSQKISVR
ncbi:MAG: T9SS type A sorting domain-containing protein [Bacteroidota bacterium]